MPGRRDPLVSLAFNLFGDGLRDVLDPKQRKWAALSEPLLEVEDLAVSFPAPPGGSCRRCASVSFTLGRERLGIVGESRARASR